MSAKPTHFHVAKPASADDLIADIRRAKMSPENKKRIQEAVATAGKDLEGRLKPIPEIPNRNPYAHLWKEIKLFFGHSYTYCIDDEVDTILAIIEWAKKNPDVPMVRCMYCNEFSAHQPYDSWKCPHCEKKNIIPDRK